MENIQGFGQLILPLHINPPMVHNTLPSEIGRIEPNRHTISNSHNFNPTQTQRFPLCTDLPRDLNQRIIIKNYKKNNHFISINT
jgi:hypothetical protein